MKKIIKIVFSGLTKPLKTLLNRNAFCNIAEGTHAGHISSIANEVFGQSYLLAKFQNGGVAPANLGDTAIGVCTDCGEAGDIIDIALAGSAADTFLCVSDAAITAGDKLYGVAGGRVSPIVCSGAIKVGVAMNDAPNGGLVEVDPQGFGMSAFNLVSAGSYTWVGSTKTEKLIATGLKDTDIIIASILKYGSAERNVAAKILSDSGEIEFTLDQNGVAGSTKINWIIIRN